MEGEVLGCEAAEDSDQIPVETLYKTSDFRQSKSRKKMAASSVDLLMSCCFLVNAVEMWL